MIPLRAFIIYCSLACIGGQVLAQDGAIDPTFNTTDGGFSLGDGLDGTADVVEVLPDNRSIVGGSFQTFNGTYVYGLVRTTSDGLRDPTFVTSAGFTNHVYAIARQTDGKLLVGGGNLAFAETGHSNLVRLMPDGAADPSFIAYPGADGSVTCIAVQSDGKIIVGGWFSTYHGVSRKGIARLNADGSLDATFNVGTGTNGSSGSVDAIQVQPNGRVLVGGDFTSYNGTAAGGIVRLTSTGAIDPTFLVGTGGNGGIYNMVLQPNGRILIEGGFGQFNGTTTGSFIRLTSSGGIDATFQTGFGLLWSLKLQPDGKILIGGSFTWAGRNRIARLNSDGTLDIGFDPGAGAEAYVRGVAVRPDGKVVAVGDFLEFNGRSVGHMALLSATGAIDVNHNPVNGANAHVKTIARQTDGKILIGGYFTGFNGEVRKYIARLNADGSLDPSFDPGTGANGYIDRILVQPDGKILIGGGFTTYNGTARNRIARLNADGSLDGSFNPGAGMDNLVSSVALQPDGKVIVVGWFTTCNGISRNRIARLNVDGTLDMTFDPGTGADGTIRDLQLLADGRVMICGQFTAYAGTTRKNLARLHVDGSLDTTFDPGVGAGPGSSYVEHLALLADGSIMVTGTFTTYSGAARSRIARVSANGAFDASFDPGAGLNGTAASLIVAPDGKVIIGGNFTSYNGISENHLVRINMDGALDPSLATGTGPSSTVESLLMTDDGKLLIGGYFTSYNGTGRNRIARLMGTARANIRVLLEGPYSGGSMSDALRTLPSFPLTEPFTAMGYSEAGYTPGATIAPSVLTTTGNNAIVDWVIVEMRPAATPSVVAASRAVLLQRDGDVVDRDGVSTVGFSGLAPGNYSVVVKSRNHLPVMLSPSTPFAYGTSTATVDFTLPGTQVYDADGRKNVGGVMVLATGDATFNEIVQYVGAGNDRDPILQRIGGSVPTATLAGYWPEDVNMDGIVKYIGANNDRDPILLNVGGSTPTAVRNAQLP